MEAFFKRLKADLKGDLHVDALSRKIYSVDASIYEVEPLGIVLPRDKNDLLLTLQLATEYGIPVTARGAATGITGSCLGKGLIIDTSKYLHQILEINIANEYAICEPGVVQDRLNEALAPYGYRLGPDTSTGNRATLGGMLANNSAGARSLHYGRMVDHVKSVELALSGGKLLTFAPVDAQEWANKRTQNDVEGHIYREIERLLHTYGAAIRERFPRIPRHASGYNLDTLLLAPPLNVSQLIAGSEGTLGIATQITMKLAKIPRHTGLCVIHTQHMLESLKSIEAMLAHQPIALEMIDDKILEAGKASPAVKDKLKWLYGNPQAIFVAEFEGSSLAEVRTKMTHFSQDMQTRKVGYKTIELEAPIEMSYVWAVRKAGLGLLLSKRSYNRAIAFIEDISVSPAQLPSFLEQFCGYLKSIGKEAGIYGHIGSGCMHIRPYMDLRKPEELALMPKIMQDVAAMLLQHGGTMSGEHGDGLIRSWLNPVLFGKDIYQAFKELKAAFDPHNLMNPGKIVDGPPVWEDLRQSPETPNRTIPTFLDFSAEGGFELVADLCNGNGECRKKENVMCPSFQASGDEYDTTRARAQALRSIIHGRLPAKELTEKALKDVLDLCIECKGCKKECPSQVDMAKMKTEVLYQYQQKHGYSWRNRLFAHLHLLNKMAAPVAPLFNWLIQTSLTKGLLSLLGVTPHRELPSLAKERFSSWFKKQKQEGSFQKVALFNDTYTEFNQPEIGKAAFKILNDLGYEIILINQQCCGRPLISKGFLKQAKANAIKVIADLQPIVEDAIPIIVLEPSCLSALCDDFKGLMGHSHCDYSQLEKTISLCTSLEEFLLACQKPLRFEGYPKRIWVHGHCHQKALDGMGPILSLLKSVPGFEVHEIESGCCGMAGAFGYEKEHHEFSLKIGELRLFPAVRRLEGDSLIVANGFSCRSQIAHGSGKRALHIAEALVLSKDEG